MTARLAMSAFLVAFTVLALLCAPVLWLVTVIDQERKR